MRREAILAKDTLEPVGPQTEGCCHASELGAVLPKIPGDETALINPTREPGEEPVAATVLLTFTQPDYQGLCRLIQASEPSHRIWDCAVRSGLWQGAPLTVAAPAMGAPYAAMVLEKLIALGARRVLILGWCGSLAPEVQIGHLILPDRALPGDGTSPHYCRTAQEIFPDEDLCGRLTARLPSAGVPWHTGPVWSTDAFFRETPSLVQACRDRGILGIDLELAALLAVGRFRQVAAAALLVVSDELSSLHWKPARGSEPFRRARRAALQLILDAAAAAGGAHA